MSTLSGRKSKSGRLKPKKISKIHQDGRRSEIAKEASRVSAVNRTTKAQTALENAMLAIEAQLNDAEEFAKQFPSGLTKEAVAKLAGVNPGSLYTPKLRPIGKQVGTFVDRINGNQDVPNEDSGESEDDSNKRRSLATRYADLKKRWIATLQDLRDTKLALQDMRSKYEKVLSEIARFELANAALEARVESFTKRDPKMVSLPRPYP
jgi:hypothetical protein